MRSLILLIFIIALIINSTKCWQYFDWTDMGDIGTGNDFVNDWQDFNSDQGFYDDYQTYNFNTDNEMRLHNMLYDYDNYYYIAPNIVWQNHNSQGLTNFDNIPNYGQGNNVIKTVPTADCKEGYSKDKTGECRPEFFGEAKQFTKLLGNVGTELGSVFKTFFTNNYKKESKDDDKN